VTRKVEEVANNTVVASYAETYGFFLVRRDNSIYAIDTTCTHQGCEVNATPKGMHCDCHGATYDFLGNVTGKPAKKPLARYALRVNADGMIEVDTRKKVPQDSPEGVIRVKQALNQKP